MSRFSHALTQAFGRDLDRTFAERVRIRHQRAGEFLAGADDPSAPPFDASGIVDLPTEVAQAGGVLDGAKSEIVAPVPTVDFAAAQFTGARQAPRRGALLDLVERDPVLTLQVRAVKPDGLGRIVCIVAPVDAT